MTVGLVELLKSKKATMSLIILACATTAVMLGKIDGVSYSAIIGTVAVIYNFVQHKIDLGLQNQGRSDAQ